MPGKKTNKMGAEVLKKALKYGTAAGGAGLASGAAAEVVKKMQKNKMAGKAEYVGEAKSAMKDSMPSHKPGTAVKKAKKRVKDIKTGKRKEMMRDKKMEAKGYEKVGPGMYGKEMRKKVKK